MYNHRWMSILCMISPDEILKGDVPIFRQVCDKSIGGNPNIDDPTSNQNDLNPAITTPPLRWLSTTNERD
jgi:hypothetical protein